MNHAVYTLHIIACIHDSTVCGQESGAGDSLGTKLRPGNEGT